MMKISGSTRKQNVFRILLGLLILGFAVVGIVRTCTVAISPSKDLEDGSLVILSGNDDSAENERQALIDVWNKLNPENKARIEELPSDADAQHAEMVARAQSDDADIDIYNLDVTWTAEFAEEGWIRQLDEDLVDASGFLRAPLETCRWNGSLWGLPFNADAGLLYYRADVGIEELPNTWGQIIDIIDRVFDTRQDPRLEAGYTGQLANYEGLTVNALEAMAAANGGGDVVRDGKVIVPPEVMQQGLERLRPKGGEPEIVLRESLAYDEAKSTQAFREGRVIFMRNWPLAYRSLASAGHPVEFDVAPLPGGTVLGGQNLAVAEHSEEPNAARELIKFLTNERSQQILFERGGFAATRAVVYADKDVIERYPYADELLDSIESAARPRPVDPQYAQFSEVLRTSADAFLRRGVPLPPDFVSQLEAALEGRVPR